MMVSDVSEFIDATAVCQCGNAKPQPSEFLTSELCLSYGGWRWMLPRSSVADDAVEDYQRQGNEG